MTTISVEDLRADLDRYLAAAATEDVVITRDGKPVAVLQAIAENGDSAQFSRSAEFWRLIRERRLETAIPWEEARKQLDAAD